MSKTHITVSTKIFGKIIFAKFDKELIKLEYTNFLIRHHIKNMTLKNYLKREMVYCFLENFNK
jgi:hypothetical protein